MIRTRSIAVSLAALYFLMAFNAYACLVPLYGTAPMEMGSVCAMPSEPPVRDACDDFKSLGVQSPSPVQPIQDWQIHHVVRESAPVAMHDGLPLSRYACSGSPPFLDRDPLSLISILRI